MTYTYGFEKLDVWKQSKDLVVCVYGITKNFPKEEKYSLVSQINRAAVSVPSNIAEGSSRSSRKEQAHFTQIAYGSLVELLTQLIISQEIGYISNEEYSSLRKRIEELTNKLNSLRKYQLESKK